MSLIAINLGGVDRERYCIERAIGHLKINRAIAPRYDPQTARYWIKFVHAA